MPDYNKGKIYTIRFNNSNEIYIGSTIQSLAVRFGEHKRKSNSSVYKLIKNKYNNDWSVCYIELYENHACNSKELLNKREGEIIRQFKEDENYDCINIVISGRTNQEYREENREKVLEKGRKYREDNREKVLEKGRQYYEKNKEKINEKLTCECGGCFTYTHQSRHLKTKKHQNFLLNTE